MEIVVLFSSRSKKETLREETAIKKVPKSLKLLESDLEQLYQKVQKLLDPLRTAQVC